MTIKKEDFYYIYDYKLSLFLKERGIYYIVKGRSLTDDKIFSQYFRTNELMSAIREWKSRIKK